MIILIGLSGSFKFENIHVNNDVLESGKSYFLKIMDNADSTDDSCWKV